MLTLEDLDVRNPSATAGDGRSSALRLTKVFRLMANELSILAARGNVETLRDNAQPLWGNQTLVIQGEEVHKTMCRYGYWLARWV